MDYDCAAGADLRDDDRADDFSPRLESPSAENA